MNHAPWWAVRSTALLIVVLLALSSQAAASTGKGLRLTIRTLPPHRRTIAQLAYWYYSSAQMSSVIEAANPWLRGFRPNRPLVTFPGLARHPTILIPSLSGWIPLDPDGSPTSRTGA
jgi:hypothetical protein